MSNNDNINNTTDAHDDLHYLIFKLVCFIIQNNNLSLFKLLITIIYLELIGKHFYLNGLYIIIQLLLPMANMILSIIYWSVMHMILNQPNLLHQLIFSMHYMIVNHRIISDNNNTSNANEKTRQQ